MDDRKQIEEKTPAASGGTQKRRMHKEWIYGVFRRRFYVALAILLQIVFVVGALLISAKVFSAVSVTLYVISVLVVIYVINKDENDSYRLMWMLLILTVPLVGGIMYIILGFRRSTAHFGKRIKAADNTIRENLAQNDVYAADFAAQYPQHETCMRYLSKTNSYPVYHGGDVEFLSPGEVYFTRLCEELAKAEKFIFIESFIIEDGEMWNAVLGILKEKVSAGVDVRLMYDDMGCFLKLPVDYSKEIEKLGIKCVVFNPFRPIVTTTQNNRDHRKIIVVDGRCAFCGGSNLADEYINGVERFGHWMDATVLVSGEAVYSFTMMFLQLWRYYRNDDAAKAQYRYDFGAIPRISAGNFIQPFGDSPLDSEYIGKQVYLHIIRSARRYVYITTPYLIIDEEITDSLRTAAKSGVDVRIIVPHIPDKKLVFATTRSYYPILLGDGVKIYEYTPGFIHSKVCLADGQTASVGTINLDYRSFYLHFECGVWFMGCRAVAQIEDSFARLFSKSELITPEKIGKNPFMRIVQSLLRLFAPLM